MSSKYIVYFVVLLLPMGMISVLINVVYSLQAHEHIEINWLFVILLTIVLDVFITWWQNRPQQKEGGSKNA